MSEEGPDPAVPDNSSDTSVSEPPPSSETSTSETASQRPASEDEHVQETGETCQNCGTLLHGAYCHACGQRHVSRLRARELLKHLADSLLDVSDLSGTLWATVLEGVRNPGRLARRYVQGERKRFVNPISYILVATTLLFLTYVAFHTELVQGMAEMSRAQWEAMGLNPDKHFFGPDGMYRKAFGLTSVEAYARGLVGILKQAQTYFTLFYCLVAAGVLRLLRSGYTFAELVTFNLYAVAQGILYHVLAIPVLFFASPMAWIMLGLPLQFGMLALVGYGFFDEGWKGAILPPLTYAIVYVLVIPIIGALIGVGIGIALA